MVVLVKNAFTSQQMHQQQPYLMYTIVVPPANGPLFGVPIDTVALGAPEQATKHCAIAMPRIESEATTQAGRAGRIHHRCKLHPLYTGTGQPPY